MTEAGEGRRGSRGEKQREEHGKEERGKENLRKKEGERGKRREKEYESDSKLISHTTQKLTRYGPHTV